MYRIASLFLLQRLKGSMSLSKTGWPNLNMVIFPPVMHLVLDDPKIVATPEIIDQIHEPVLEDHRILAESIAEQLGISR